MRIEFRKAIPLPLVETDHQESEIWETETFLFENDDKILLYAPSGKGKTTLLSMIYGLREDYLGEISIDGVDIRKMGLLQLAELRKKRLSYVFQGLELFDELSALENILLKNRLTKYKSNREIFDLADELEISSLMDRKVSILSYGQKQRVAIIRALCQPFEFFLADEIFSHLDPDLKTTAMRVIIRELEKRGSGMLFTSLKRYDDNNFTRKYRV